MFVNAYPLSNYQQTTMVIKNVSDHRLQLVELASLSLADRKKKANKAILHIVIYKK